MVRRSRRAIKRPKNDDGDELEDVALPPSKRRNQKASSTTTKMTKGQPEPKPSQIEEQRNDDEATTPKKPPGLLPSSRIQTMATRSAETKRKSIGRPPTAGSASRSVFVSEATPSVKNVVCVLPPPNYAVDYLKILDGMEHPAWHFNGNGSAPFAFLKNKRCQGALINDVSHRILTRDVETFEAMGNIELLFMTDEHINLFNQFTHRGDNYQQHDEAGYLRFLPMPADFFTRVKADGFDFEADTVASGYCKHLEAALLHADVIDITIHGEKHYSKAWIFNAWSVITRACYRATSDSDPMPVILVANTLPSGAGGKTHDPEFVGKKLRKFLNQAQKRYGFGVGAAFTIKTMPVVVLKVPEQERGWTCGLHCMVMTHKMRQFVLTNGTTKEHVRALKAGQHLDHEAEDVLIMRSDLLKLVSGLIKEGENPRRLVHLLDDSPVRQISSATDLDSSTDSENTPCPPNGRNLFPREDSAGHNPGDGRSDSLDSEDDKSFCRDLDIRPEDHGDYWDNQESSPEPKHSKPWYQKLREKRQFPSSRKTQNDESDDEDDDSEPERDKIRQISLKNRMVALKERAEEKRKIEIAYEKSVKRAEEKKKLKAEAASKRKKEKEEAAREAEKNGKKKNKEETVNDLTSIGNGRVKKQAAASVKQLKDKALRTQALKAFESTRNCYRMGQYDDETMNKTCPRFQSLNFTIDNVVPQPSKARGNLKREVTAISCAGPDDQAEMKAVIKFLYENQDKVVLQRDKLDFDRMHFGARRPTNARNAKQNIDKLTSRPGNDEAFKNSQSTKDLCSPAPQTGKKPKKVKNFKLAAMAKSADKPSS